MQDFDFERFFSYVFIGFCVVFIPTVGWPFLVLGYIACRFLDFFYQRKGSEQAK